ncbi:hypothetical protein TPHA_0M00590 [Tetrapisispora phaffii CBS 4417]|uniref:Uncharacterized protein n=1 Tax=Tetrapisispora phaffii (strain ATCC 24235 / CBS 4417 / NBRC 1672 / NRRL Y-8282 / UCD 70-5) TaxID=1071381 RepID=G8C0B9_TETPH|nr:hypothetical protein TPHA_0M00590 [Tetrapisispora phaffii CBS 4417]CCE65634.1 hypothetical protein TPHA_0M00590 [Tetrapisispora phaffii CBS 4417]
MLQKYLFCSQRLVSTKRAMSTIPKTFKSIIYSRHDVEDCTGVLKLHNYEPKQSIEDNIVLRTLAFPVNPSDINQLQGVYPSIPDKTLEYGTEEPSAIAGNEGVFEVVHVPQDGNAQEFAVGDLVIPLRSNQGTWTNYKIIEDPKEIIKVNGLDLLTGATVSVNGCTAMQLVNDYVDWSSSPSENQWIVQNAGTSGVSKLVTQIAKAKGIKTLSVIRDRDDFEEVAEDLTNKYGATRVISETENNDKAFNKTELPKLLGNDYAIRLALNSVGGKSSTAIARKLAKDSLMLTYGGMSKQPVTLPTSLFIFKNLDSKGFWITENYKKDPFKKQKDVAAFIKLYNDNKIVKPDETKDFQITNWDTQNDDDITLLNKIKNAIKAKGKKQMIVVN